MVVIIGSGLAGYMLAKEIRKLDPDTKLTIITNNRGDFYSKPLLSTALTAKKDPAELVIANAESLAEQLNAVIVTNTKVQSIDSQNKTIKLADKSIAYDKLVLACGSDTLHAPLEGDAVDQMFSINDLEAYQCFRQWLTPDKKHIAILGSGLVGCEFANDLLNTDHEIDIISLDSYPLAKFVPEPIGRVLQEAFAEKGVRWHLSQPAVSVNFSDSKFQIGLQNGEVITADGVLSAIGLRANTDLAKTAGLEINSGIVVNRHLQTSDPHIYALGDCAEVHGQLKQYVAPLLNCARALAKVLTEGQDQVIYPSMPIVIKTPACPLVTIPVPLGVEGEWQYEGEGRHLSALFYDTENQLRGFTLIGDKVRDKFTFAKQLPLVFES